MVTPRLGGGVFHVKMSKCKLYKKQKLDGVIFQLGGEHLHRDSSFPFFAFGTNASTRDEELFMYLLRLKMVIARLPRDLPWFDIAAEIISDVKAKIVISNYPRKNVSLTVERAKITKPAIIYNLSALGFIFVSFGFGFSFCVCSVLQLWS